MNEHRTLSETEKNFIKKFKSENHVTPTMLVLDRHSTESITIFFLNKLLFVGTFGLIVYLQIKNIRTYRQHNMKLKLGENLFKVLVINGYIPICVYKFLDEKLRNNFYSSTYTILTKPENSNHLIKIYRYYNSITYRNSQYFINNTNIILCRYFVNYVYD